MYPRVSVKLPFEFRLFHELKYTPGVVLNASEAGLLIQTFKDMPIGQKVSIKILLKLLLQKRVRFMGVRADSTIIWRDTYAWDGWDSYQYGLKFIQILDGDYRKLKLVLNTWPKLEKMSVDHNWNYLQELIDKPTEG
jgi:hypothetical protein